MTTIRPAKNAVYLFVFNSIVSMPNIASAAKQARQAEKRALRRKPVKSQMLTLYKSMIKHGESKDAKKAVALLPMAMKAVDMAAKRNIIHSNNASRKKSRMQKIVNELGGSVEKKAEPAKKAATKKPAAKTAAKPAAKKPAAKKITAKKSESTK